MDGTTCRREKEAGKQCGKEVAETDVTKNPLQWCDDDRQSLPYWPLNEDGSVCKPEPQEY